MGCRLWMKAECDARMQDDIVRDAGEQRTARPHAVEEFQRIFASGW